MILEAGPWRMEVSPEIGGSVRSLTWNGLSILANDNGAAHPVQAAGCFVMLPFANRIRDGVVRLPGGASRTVTAGGVGDPIHPLHGIGWLRPWQVVTFEPERGVFLKLVHTGDSAWPWPFEAFLSFGLRSAGFTSTLMLANTGTEPMPASIGYHPWFPAHGARFTAAGTQLWLPDAAGVCAQAEPCSGFRDAAPGDRFLDASLTGWDGEVEMQLHGHSFTLVARTPSGPVPRIPDTLHIYTPAASSRFCLEPQSARSGAFDLAPGEPGGPALLKPVEELVMSIAILAPDSP